MLIQKRKYSTAILHSLNFGWCPDKEHSHSATLEITSSDDIGNFFIDAIIPCDTDSVDEFLNILYNECAENGITLKTAELYLADKELSFIKLF